MSTTSVIPESNGSKNAGSHHAGHSHDSATARVAEKAHSAVDIAAANLEQAEKALHEARLAAGHKAEHAAQDARVYADQTVSSVKSYINEHPVKSVGIALAGGFLLSALLKK